MVVFNPSDGRTDSRWNNSTPSGFDTLIDAYFRLTPKRLALPSQALTLEKHTTGDGRQSVHGADAVAGGQFVAAQVRRAYQEFLLALAEVNQLREVVVRLAIHLGNGLCAHVINTDYLAALYGYAEVIYCYGKPRAW